MPTPVAAKIYIYLSPKGNDHWNGRLPYKKHYGVDGPLASLEAARNIIREIVSHTGLPHGGFVVTLEPGEYTLSRTFKLSQKDGGTPHRPVVYRGSKSGSVILTGGIELSHWSPLTSAILPHDLSIKARVHCIVCKISNADLSRLGAMVHQGFGIPTPIEPAELFYSHKRMTIARYPNHGYMLTGREIGTHSFSYVGADLPQGIKYDSNLWVHGYWDFDWADTYDKVSNIDTSSHTIHTTPPISGYGYKPSRRFYIMNAPQALNGPDQYYIDRSNGVVIFWPPAHFQSKNAQLSLLDKSMIKMTDVDCVNLENMHLEDGRANGILITGGSHDTVEGCTIQDMGNDGIDMDSSYHSGVINCNLHDLGDTGVEVICGDRKTLTPGGDYVTNCTLDRYAQWDFTYHPGISVSGVGNLIDHNEIYNAPHQAISFSGNNELIEFNNIHNVCTDTGDAGAVYDGRDLSQRGNIIRDNYFHNIAPNISTPGNFDGVISVYLDDCLCGTTIEDNIFNHAGQGVMIGGGRDNTVQNNIFIACKPAISVDSRGEGWAADWFEGKDPILIKRLKAVPYNQPPYSVEYPDLANILSDDPAAPLHNRIFNNICVGGSWLELQDGLTNKIVDFSNNITGASLSSLGFDETTFAMLPHSRAFEDGFQNIPFKKIGTYHHT